MITLGPFAYMGSFDLPGRETPGWIWLMMVVLMVSMLGVSLEYLMLGKKKAPEQYKEQRAMLEAPERALAERQHLQDEFATQPVTEPKPRNRL